MAVLLVLTAVCAGFAWWASHLAEERGRAPVAHAMLGFFLGPIGVLITALRGPDHVALTNRPTRAPAVNPSSLRGCPKCGNNVNRTDRVCGTCGATL